MSAPLGKVKEFSKMYKDAGVNIEIVKFDAIYARADDEVDYCFELAKALGARAISCEISVKDTMRLGQFADKHKLMVGYHGHAETALPIGRRRSATRSTTALISTSGISSPATTRRRCRF